MFLRGIRVSVFVFISGVPASRWWRRDGRACHSVRAAVLNPHAWVGNRGVQGTARPTNVNGLDLAFGTFQKFVSIREIRVSVFAS